MTDPIQEQDSILGDVAGQFDGVEVETRVVGVVPGRATLRVTNVFVNRSSGESQRKQLCIACEVLAHEKEKMVGREYVKKWGLETTDNLEWLNGDLVNLEIQPMPNVTVSEMKRIMVALSEIVFDTTLVENPDKRFPPNSFINAGARRTDFGSGKTEQKRF